MNTFFIIYIYIKPKLLELLQFSTSAQYNNNNNNNNNNKTFLNPNTGALLLYIKTFLNPKPDARIESFCDRETQRNLIRCGEKSDLPPSSGSTQLSVSLSFMFCSILFCFLFFFIWLDIWVIRQEGSGANFKSTMFLLSLSLSESFYYLPFVFSFLILVSYSRVCF